MKAPKCKYCGKTNHYSYQCWQKAKTKPIAKRNTSPFLAKKPKKVSNVSSQSKNRRKQAVATLDRLISKYVRKSYANANGRLQCYTCGVWLGWKNADNAHYISRRYMGTRFDLDNLRPCCAYCNRTLHGNLELYKKNLTREIGEDKVLALIKKKSNKIDTIDIELLIEKYKKLLKNM